MKARIQLLVVAIVSAAICCPSPAEARRPRPRRSTKMTAKDHFALEAAKALFGVGLKIKRSKRSVTISPKRGGLTQAKFNRYVEEVYLPALKRVSLRRHNRSFRFRKDYRPRKWNPQANVKLGHILLEPRFKCSLCVNITSSIGHKPSIVEAYKRASWCAYQAMLESIAPILEYRGRKVTWKGTVPRGNLKITDEIYKKDASGNYPIIVTVAGGRRWYTQEGINILFKLADDVDRNFAKKLYKKAESLRVKARKEYHRLLKQVAIKQRKLMRGKKIIFANTRFYDQIATPPARGPLPCGKTFFLAFSPKRARKQGYHLAVEMNGTECQSIYLDAKRHYRGDVDSRMCGRYMKTGNNLMKVAMHYNIDSFDHKRREWRRHSSGRGYVRKSITYTKTRRGKRLYSNSITCTYTR